MGKMDLVKLQMIRERGREQEYPRYGTERRQPDMMRGGRPRYDEHDGRRMGFDDDDDRYHGKERGGNHPQRFGGTISMEEWRGSHQPMTRDIAEAWVADMQGSDPAKPHGGKWTPEQIKPVATKYGVPTDGEKFWEFFAVINAMYSDYYVVAKKYNALNPDFFADLAMAFINDKDAKDGKTMRYYKHIVE